MFFWEENLDYTNKRGGNLSLTFPAGVYVRAPIKGLVSES
jgi:hypothetical protein